jgi:phosphatidylglycerol:prolipoprotein diacylglycerol transferase
MKTLFIITTTEHSFFYSLFYVAAFLIAAGIFIFSGLKKKYPLSTWLLITLFGVLFFIIGNKLSTINAAGWQQILKGNGFPETGRSVLGGIAGLITGLLVAKHWLKFKQPVLDNLVLALPIGIAITRLGCLFGGCCYGTETSLPWAVQYGNSFHVFHIHPANLQIPANSALSLPLHPTQIYDMLFCLIICLLVFITKKTWKASGSRFLFVVFCYAIFRFVNEFFRDSTMMGQWGETIMGFKPVQWIMLCLVSLIAILLVFREIRIRGTSAQVENEHQINLHREYAMYLFILLFLAFTYHQLAPFEILTLTFFAVLLLPVYVYHLFSQIIAPQFRWFVPISFLISLITMGQVNADQSRSTSSKGYKGWFSVNTFGSSGSYPEKEFNCNGEVTKILKRNYSTVGAGISYHYKPTDYRHFTISSNIYSNSDRTDELYYTSYQSTAMSIMASYSSRSVGVTLGMAYGSWEEAAGSYSPILGFWFGRKDDLFVETNVLTNYHLMGPPGGFQIGIGSGFGKIDRTIGRAGLSIMPGLFDPFYILGGYFEADIQLNDRFSLKPSLFAGREFGGSLNLEMHLGKDRWKSKAVVGENP